MEKTIVLPLQTIQALEIIQGIVPSGFMEDGILLGDGKLMSISKWCCLACNCPDIPESSTHDAETYWVLPLHVVRQAVKEKKTITIRFNNGLAYYQSFGNDVQAEMKLKAIKLRFMFTDDNREQPGEFNIQLPILSMIHRAAKKLDLEYSHYKLVTDGRYLCWWQNNPDWYAIFMGFRDNDTISWEERMSILDKMAGKEPLF